MNYKLWEILARVWLHLLTFGFLPVVVAIVFLAGIGRALVILGDSVERAYDYILKFDTGLVRRAKRRADDKNDIL